MSPETMAYIHAACFKDARPWSCDEFASLLESPHVSVIGTDEGFVLFRISPPEAELLTIATLPKARRKGVASGLLRAFEAASKDANVENIILEVSQKNTGAIALYTKFGYAQIAIRPKYYALGNNRFSDALIMQKIVN